MKKDYINKRKQSKGTKYLDGYKGKIKYWASEYSKAINANAYDDARIALVKLSYFTTRQELVHNVKIRQQKLG